MSTLVGRINAVDSSSLEGKTGVDMMAIEVTLCKEEGLMGTKVSRGLCECPSWFVRRPNEICRGEKRERETCAQEDVVTPVTLSEDALPYGPVVSTSIVEACERLEELRGRSVRFAEKRQGTTASFWLGNAL